MAERYAGTDGRGRGLDSTPKGKGKDACQTEAGEAREEEGGGRAGIRWTH